MDEPAAVAALGAGDGSTPPRGRRRRLWWWIAVAFAPVLVALALVGLKVFASSPGADFHVVRLHTRAPTFDLADLRNPDARIALSTLRGKPIVVNFWASWCLPCRHEMKGFEAVNRRVGGRVTIVGVDTNDSRADALALAGDVGTTYPLAFDPDGEVSVRYGAVGLPSTVFIDAHGIMLERRLGAMTSDDLEHTIERLFS